MTSFVATLVADASPVEEDHDGDDREEDTRGAVGDDRVHISQNFLKVPKKLDHFSILTIFIILSIFLERKSIKTSL